MPSQCAATTTTFTCNACQAQGIINPQRAATTASADIQRPRTTTDRRFATMKRCIILMPVQDGSFVLPCHLIIQLHHLLFCCSLDGTALLFCSRTGIPTHVFIMLHFNPVKASAQHSSSCHVQVPRHMLPHLLLN